MDRQRLHQSALASRLPQVEAKPPSRFIAHAAGGLPHESTLGAKRTSGRQCDGRLARPVRCRSLCRHWATTARAPNLLVGFLIASAKTDSPAGLIESSLFRDHSPGRWRSFAWLAGVGVFLSFRRQGRSHFVARRPHLCEVSPVLVGHHHESRARHNVVRTCLSEGRDT